MLARFDGRDYDPGVVSASKRGRRVSVCLPARNEEATVGRVVATIAGQLMGMAGVVDELVVVDDGSSDRTAEVAGDAGARVVPAASVLPGHAAGHGKGRAMWRGLQATTGDVVVFCDADVRDFDPVFVLGLVGPLLADDGLALVKGHYRRPLDGGRDGGGRVTELVARPVLSMFFPHLSGLVQPLAGEVAARRDILEAVPFVDGYGVDLGLLIDVAARVGVDRMAQSDLGQRIHRNRSLEELGLQATAVLQVALQRAGLAPGGSGEWSTIVRRPAGTAEVTMTERPPVASLGRRRRSA